jgi:WD40 repeat protein
VNSTFGLLAVQTLSIGKKKRIYAIAFATDGLRAATGSDKGQIVIWDVE